MTPLLDEMEEVIERADIKYLSEEIPRCIFAGP